MLRIRGILLRPQDQNNGMLTALGATSMNDQQLLRFFLIIADGDLAAIRQQLESSPVLATQPLRTGATRQNPTACFLQSITRQVYAGDTGLHVAAAALRPSVCRLLLASGANVTARNRRGCEPLHYAAENSRAKPQSQTATIRTLLAAGADVDATNMDGATPLQKAVRARSVAAVKALIEGAADIHKPNGSGSTPWDLTLQSTGRSGSGTLEAHSARRRIQQILGKPGAVSES